MEKEPQTFDHGRTVTSENCLSCGLHAGCKRNPFFRPITDTRSDSHGKNTVLVISDYPDPRDEKAGLYYHRGVSKLREEVLNNLDCRWEFHTVARCSPKQGEKPKPRQFKLCIEEHLKPTIIKMKPRAIVCMGKEALNAVLGENSPKNMNDLKGGYLYLEELNMRVYCAEHPAKLTIPEVNLEALSQHYFSVFSKAEAFAMETEYREQINFSLLRTPVQVMELAKQRFTEFSFDIETNYPIMDKRGLKDPTRNTFWKPNARCISLAITYYDERNKKYVNSVIVEEGLKDLVPLQRLFRDRVVIAHHAKFDIQGLYALLGLDVLALCRSFEDTQVPFYISDQNRMSTSLKNLARHYLENVGDWETEGKELVVRANIEVVKHRKALEARITENGKLRRLWDVYEKGIGKPMLGSEKAAWTRAHKAVRDSGLSSLLDVVKIDNALRKELAAMPVPGLCSYADIPIVKLAEYNAEDTLRTLQLWREVIPFLEKVDGFTYDRECYEMIKEFIRTICFVERDGFLIDEEALNRLEEKLLHEEEQFRALVMANPRAMEAAERSIPVKRAREKGQEPAWDKVLNPKNASFMAEIAREYGVFHLGNRTEKGAVTFGKLVLPGIIKHFQKHTNNEKAIELFEALDGLRFSMDLRSKFINNWRMWMVDGVFHCDYKVIANVNLGFARGKDAGGGAQSGRLSCTRINLQQLFKLELLREVFKAPDGWFIAELDYKSLEPMLMAFVTNCERLKDVFRRGLDLYRVTCNDIFMKGVDLNQDDDTVRRLLADPNLISDKERKLFKVGFLSWVYGTGIRKFAELLEISEDEARAFFIRAKEIYYEIFEYKQSIQQMVDEGRPLYSYTGRRRTFPVLPPQDYSEEEQERYRKDRNKAFRIAVNAGIQVLGSDITLKKAAEIQRWIERNNYQNVVRLCNLVHDSVWLYIKKSHAHLYWEIIAIMEDLTTLPFKMDVPLVAEGTVGYTLAESMGLDHQKERQVEIMKELGIWRG